MKLPFSSSQNISSANVKHQIIAGGRNCYEPKSVLDICQSPPRPIAGKSSEFNSVDHNSIVLSSSEDHGTINQSEEWDSLMRELGLHDDSTKLASAFDLPDLPPFFPSDLENLNPNPDSFDFVTGQYDNGNEFYFVDELIRIAECFETQSLQLAQVILARLHHRLSSASGKPLQRAAFYFKEALQNLLIGSTPSCTSSEIVQVIKAYRTFSNVSPIPMFASFTANQAILEAVDGAMIIHVIDFDIGLGGHWASFMKDIAEKAASRNVGPPAVRITAIVPEEYETESSLIRDNLYQFAFDLKLRFDIHFVSVLTFEYLSFKSVKFITGEKTAVLLSPMIFRRIGTGFIHDLRLISPQVVVHVDSEGSTASGTSFCRQTVMDGLEFYSTIFESLEAANVGVDWIRNVETFVLLPKIIAAVGAGGRRATPWREAFGGAGMRPVGLSQFADFQADCLLRRVQVRGFHVAKAQAEMVLCWHDRPIVATSAWRF